MVTCRKTERYVSDVQTRWPVVLREATSGYPLHLNRRRSTVGSASPKLHSGVMKRGDTWSCVIRGEDSATGISKRKWVGGFSTEQDAKAARDEELIYPDTVTSLMTKLIRADGQLPHARLHDLRHLHTSTS